MRINEIFVSIQGEGKESGLLTTFIRTGECNLNCNYCDTINHTVKEMTIEEIIKEVDEIGLSNICITGGEPLLEADLIDLVKVLSGYNIVIETNGSMLLDKIYQRSVSLSVDIKVPSSGEQDSFNVDNLVYLRKQDTVKFVVSDYNDLLYIGDFLPQIILPTVYISLVMGEDDIKNRGFIDEVYEWMLTNRQTQVHLMVQLHKILGLK